MLMARMGWGMENATPAVVLEQIRTQLDQVSNDPVLWCDPCCGTGLALAQLTEGTKNQTYGVELKPLWAREGRSRLTQVLKGEWASVTVSPAVFSGVLLNPPLPDQRPGDESPRLAATVEWLTIAGRLLRSRGSLVAILPQDLVGTAPVAEWLTGRLTEVRLWRFPAGISNPLGQCVVIGQKRSDPGLQMAMAQKLRSYVTTEELPEIDPATGPHYVLPAARRIPHFSGGLIDLDDVMEVMERATLTPDTCMPRQEILTYDRAPLPLHTGQLAVLLSSGGLNGLIGSGPHRHLVKGSTSKVTRHTIEHDEHLRRVKKEREVYRVTIRTLDASGVVRTLVTAGAPDDSEEAMD